MTAQPHYTQSPASLLQRLIQFNTTNPPGNEADCIAFIRGLLVEAGIDSQVFALTAERPNLVARLSGQGTAAPLLLYGHADVVTTENQQWTYPPFEGKIADGFIWGRGALDMKGGITMMLAAFLRAKIENLTLPGDIVLAIVSDEEGGGDFGAKFLVEQHPEQFAGIRYAIGEFGGFSFTFGNHRFYPIQIAEKQGCWMKAVARGMGGHGSVPVQGGAVSKLAKFLLRLDRNPLPIHVTPPARIMFQAIGASLGGLLGFMVSLLAYEGTAGFVLKLLGERGRIFSPILRNTANPTMLEGSSKINVIPHEASAGLDGRLLPGYKPEDMLAELRPIARDDVTLEVIRYDPGPGEVDMGWYDTLAGVLREADPEGIPVPLLLSGVTDGRFFSKLGIQTYGFLPMQLPADFNFSGYIHSADERIPVDALEFGAQAMMAAIQRAK